MAFRRRRLSRRTSRRLFSRTARRFHRRNSIRHARAMRGGIRF